MKPVPHRKQNDARHVAFLLIPIIVFAGVLVFAGDKIAPVIVNHLREHRIKQIYASLNLDDSYLPQTSNIFGDKRPLQNQPGRTEASSVTFIRGATPSDTRADLKKRVEAAGFSFVQEEYPGDVDPVDEFRDKSGEYVRVDVVSKLRTDAIQNKLLMKQPIDNSVTSISWNAGPSKVTIKVNLDDNNE